MKRKMQKMVEVEETICNICNSPIGQEAWHDSGASKRIEFLRGLFKTKDFDAHERCINNVVREAFKGYAEPRKTK